jgi:hypothetical protein
MRLTDAKSWASFIGLGKAMKNLCADWQWDCICTQMDGIGSLGVKDWGYSEKVVHPQSLDEAVSSQKIVHMSAGQCHTLASSTKGSLLGFGDKWQLANAHNLQSGKEVFTEILHWQIAKQHIYMPLSISAADCVHCF